MSVGWTKVLSKGQICADGSITASYVSNNAAARMYHWLRITDARCMSMTDNFKLFSISHTAAGFNKSRVLGVSYSANNPAQTAQWRNVVQAYHKSSISKGASTTSTCA